MDMLPFDGIRVVEVGCGTAVAFCGKLFADFGAEVVKIEPPGGDPGRRHPPLTDAGNSRTESAYFAWLNTNKRSVTADLGSEQGMQRARAIASGADVVLDARALGNSGNPPRSLLEAVSPATGIEIDFSWFGESGPYSSFVATEAVCRALSGAIHSAGPAEGPPLVPHDTQAGVVAGLAGFSLAAAALLGREQGGRRYAVSVHEVLLHLAEIEIGMALEGRDVPRAGVNRFGGQYPASIYATSDGWLGIFTVTAPQWRSLCKVIGRPELIADPRFVDGASRFVHADAIDALLAPIIATRPAAEWFELCSTERLPAVIVPTMAQLLQQKVHRDRSAFVPVQIGSATFEAPILPQRMGEAGPLRGGRAPFAGEHDADYPDRRTARAARGREQRASGLPLAGVRIVDLTMGWAGPFSTRHLADLGAEVIKVESTRYPDWWRGTNYTAEYYSEQRYEKSTYFNMMNRNKLGVTLDLTNPEGVRLLKELVSSADAVIENYSAEVLPKLGLDYPALSQVNSKLVMVSMPAFGSNNTWSNTRAYGGTLEQASGLPTVTGREGWPPAMTSYAYGDPIGGYNAAAALLVGLTWQKCTGQGRFIDLSQVEGMLSLVAPALIEQSVTGTVGPRIGNRHPVHAPHGCFRCSGEDEWIVIAVTGDLQWVALSTEMGRPDLRDDPALRTEAGRRAQQDRIEAAIEAWTMTVGADEAMQRLQQARVPAGAVRSVRSLLHDPHLEARRFWRFIERPGFGAHVGGSSFFREDGEPAPLRNGAPTLGQHNAFVLGGLLGLAPAQLHRLAEGGVIGNAAVPK